MASCEKARSAAPPAASPASASETAKPAVPAFKSGTVASDRTGARVWVVKALTERPGGRNVVVEIEGKLVGVMPSTLQLRGETGGQLTDARADPRDGGRAAPAGTALSRNPERRRSWR